MSVVVSAAQAPDAIRAAIARQRAAVEQDVKDAVADAFFAIQSASPVDTHRFQASHTLSTGSPSTFVEPEGPVHPLRGQDHVDAVLQDWHLGEDIWHASNLPYSDRLANQGWSQQAPDPGWMQREYHAAFAGRFGGGA